MDYRLTNTNLYSLFFNIPCPKFNPRDKNGKTTLFIYIVCLCLSLFALNANAEIRLNSKNLSAVINPQTLESEFVQYGDLIITQKQIVRNRQVINVKFMIVNMSASMVNLAPIDIIIGNELHNKPDMGGGFGASFYDYLDPFVVDIKSEETRKLDIELLKESSDLSPFRWFGWTSRYNVEAIRFHDNANLNYELVTSGNEILNPSNLVVKLKPKLNKLLSRESITIQFDYLLSTKSRSLLQDPQIKLEDLLFINLWDWFRSICFLIWRLMDLIFLACGNWGASIIILALVIRIITIPVTRFSLYYQEQSIKQQREIAPLIQDIKKNYKGIEQSKKIISLYESHNYDNLAPFKSMMGLFIQIPIFIALFNVIGDAWELSGQSFLWITDLSKSDRLLDWRVDLPYFGSFFNLLPVIMAISTFVSTWLAAKHSGNKDLPVMSLFGLGALFFVLFYSFPSALVLYWLSSNVIQLLQQLIGNLKEAKNV